MDEEQIVSFKINKVKNGFIFEVLGGESLVYYIEGKDTVRQRVDMLMDRILPISTKKTVLKSKKSMSEEDDGDDL